MATHSSEPGEVISLGELKRRGLETLVLIDNVMHMRVQWNDTSVYISYPIVQSFCKDELGTIRIDKETSEEPRIGCLL